MGEQQFQMFDFQLIDQSADAAILQVNEFFLEFSLGDAKIVAPCLAVLLAENQTTDFLIQQSSSFAMRDFVCPLKFVPAAQFPDGLTGKRVFQYQFDRSLGTQLFVYLIQNGAKRQVQLRFDGRNLAYRLG